MRVSMRKQQLAYKFKHFFFLKKEEKQVSEKTCCYGTMTVSTTTFNITIKKHGIAWLDALSRFLIKLSVATLKDIGPSVVAPLCLLTKFSQYVVFQWGSISQYISWILGGCTQNFLKYVLRIVLKIAWLNFLKISCENIQDTFIIKNILWMLFFKKWQKITFKKFYENTLSSVLEIWLN